MNDKAFNFLFLRQMIGYLGIILPVLVIIFGVLGQNGPEWYYSISATYYANSGTVFTLIMGAVAFFLISYRMYSRLDSIVNFLAGVAALLIILFPCYTTELIHVGTFQTPVDLSATIHNISACVFFCLLAFNILFLFTRSSGNPTKEKLKRNRVYRICGLCILFFMVLQVVLTLSPLTGPYTLINEAGMLIFFGVAWLVKGNALLRDNKQ